MKAILSSGKKWESRPASFTKTNLHSECGKFQIMETKQGKFRLIAFDHEPTLQFPQAEFWMREYETLNAAAHQAECM